MAGKHYLHPANPEFKAKEFRAIDQGTTPNGTRITRIKGVHPSIGHQYKEGIMVEEPNGKTTNIYGDYHAINSITADLKKNPDKVVSQIRPLGQSKNNSYVLNQKPQNHRIPIDAEKQRHLDIASKMFPKHDSKNAARTRLQEEKQAMREHIKETENAGKMFPSSVMTED